jgi:hypothetical protein
MAKAKYYNNFYNGRHQKFQIYLYHSHLKWCIFCKPVKMRTYKVLFLIYHTIHVLTVPVKSSIESI